MKSVTVSVIKDQLHMFGSVSLIDPGNVKVNPQTLTSSSMIFEIPNPKAGHYQLTLPNLGGKYEYNVQRVSSQAIEFTHSFIYQQSVRKNSPAISITTPFKGEIKWSNINLLLSEKKLFYIDFAFSFFLQESPLIFFTYYILPI